MDTLKVSSRLNSFSRALNWVCIEGEVNSVPFFSMKKGSCLTGFFQQRVEILIPEANNSRIAFTLKTSKELEVLFILFLLMQIGLIATLIAATKKAEEEKMKNELEISKLSRKMFHDIRSPLASLNSIAETTTFEAQTEKDIFNASILRINEIANSLLSKTRSNAIRLPSFTNIDELLLSVIEEKKMEYPHLGLTLEYDGKMSAQCFLEPSEFKSIFSNLINNSIEATNGSPIILLKINQKNERLELLMSDNGSGIPKSIIAQIGIAEITTKKDGNGIGLKEAIETISEWGGSFEILKSNSEGTEIKLSFLSKKEKEIIILIDDDYLTRVTWESKARKSGVELRTFSSSNDFSAVKNEFSKNSFIYIDSELGTEKGEVLAMALHKEGFLNISLATGHPPEHFIDYKFLKSVISKTAPF